MSHLVYKVVMDSLKNNPTFPHKLLLQNKQFKLAYRNAKTFDK